MRISYVAAAHLYNIRHCDVVFHIYIVLSCDNSNTNVLIWTQAILSGCMQAHGPDLCDSPSAKCVAQVPHTNMLVQKYGCIHTVATIFLQRSRQGCIRVCMLTLARAMSGQSKPYATTSVQHIHTFQPFFAQT
jgi:hypothetical protein